VKNWFQAFAFKCSLYRYPEGLVLDTGRYLAALWDAARLLAESEATPGGAVQVKFSLPYRA
jgi:hypothetical protein